MSEAFFMISKFINSLPSRLMSIQSNIADNENENFKHGMSNNMLSDTMLIHVTLFVSLASAYVSWIHNSAKNLPVDEKIVYAILSSFFGGLYLIFFCIRFMFENIGSTNTK